MAYFIRRCGDDGTVIELHPDDREESVAGGLALGDAEDLRASKIDGMRSAAAPLPIVLDEGARPAINCRPRPRQLGLRFE
jgi:hypothetical protein